MMEYVTWIESAMDGDPLTLMNEVASHQLDERTSPFNEKRVAALCDAFVKLDKRVIELESAIKELCRVLEKGG